VGSGRYEIFDQLAKQATSQYCIGPKNLCS